MCRRLKRNQNCRSVVAVPFLALSEIKLETVGAWKIPGRAGDGNTNFLIDSPDIPVHPETLPIDRTNRLERLIERVAMAVKPRRVILAANRKREWTGGKIKQVAVKGEIAYRHLKFAGILQGDINPRSGCSGVVGADIQERIKRRGRVRVQ